MWLDVDKVAMPASPRAAGWPRVVVALPARDEASSIAKCLAALSVAARRSGAPVTLLVSANNCSDDTAVIAGRGRLRGVTLAVEEVTLPMQMAHAGGARRHAMDRAADFAGDAGVVMTTDADSCVDPDWIAANLVELSRGADAVAGMVTFNAADRASLPVLTGRAAEWRLSCLQARIEHLLDPRPHDPWPRHIWAWGASIALTVAAYRAVGGLPAVPLAEDRALAAAIEAGGLRLRRSYAPLVYTSPRRAGRAPGGFADLLDSYSRDPSALCDAALEPTADFARRVRARARARIAGRVALPVPGRRLSPSELTAEIELADRIIALLERRATRRADSPATALAA